MKQLYSIAFKLATLVKYSIAAQCSGQEHEWLPSIFDPVWTTPTTYYTVDDVIMVQSFDENNIVTLSGSPSVCDPWTFSLSMQDGSSVDASIFTISTSLATFSVYTGDQSKAGVYSLNLHADSDNNPSYVLDPYPFDVIICNTCCDTTLTIGSAILPTFFVQYNLNDPALVIPLDSTAVTSTIPGCTIEYMTINQYDGVNLVGQPLNYAYATRTLTVESSNVSDVTQYDLTIKAVLMKMMPLTPTANYSFQVEIFNPCDQYPLTIDSSAIPSSLAYSVYHPTSTVDIVRSAITSAQPSCNPNIILWVEAVSFPNLDETEVFWFDDVNNQLSAFTDDPSKPGLYQLQLKAGLNTDPITQIVTYDFDFTVDNPCATATLTIDPSIVSSSTIDYFIGEPSHGETFLPSKVSSTDLSGYCPTVHFYLEVDADGDGIYENVSTCCCTSVGINESAVYTDIFTHSWCQQTELRIYTTDVNHLATPTLLMKLVAIYYDSALNTPTALYFTVNLLDPCPNNVFSLGPVLQAVLTDLTYEVYSGNSALYIQFDDSFITQSVTAIDCGNIVMSMTNADNTQLNSSIFLFDNFQEFSIWTSAYTGDYDLKLKVMNDGYANEEFFQFTAHLLDPCDAATISISPGVILSNPISYKLFHPPNVHTLYMSAVSSDVDPSFTCPSFELGVKNQDGTDIDPTVFSYSPFYSTLTTYSTDYNHIGQIDLKITANYVGSSTTPAEYALVVQITDSCSAAILGINPSILSSTTIDYYIDYPAFNESLDVNFVSSNIDKIDETYCPDLSFFFDASDGLVTQSAGPCCPTTSAHTTWFEHEYSEVDFFIDTSDFNLKGTYAMSLKVQYQSAPTSSAPLAFTVNLKDPCEEATLTLDVMQIPDYTYEVYDDNVPDVYPFNVNSLVMSTETAAACPNIILEVYVHDGSVLPASAFASFAETSYPEYALTFDIQDQAKVSPPNYGLMMKARYDTDAYVNEVNYTPITITLTASCYAANLSIQPEIFLPWDDTTGSMVIFYDLYSGTETITFSDVYVNSSVNPLIQCGEIILTVTTSSGGAIDSAVFSYNAMQEFSIYSSDPGKAGTHTMILEAKYLGGSLINQYSFTVQITDSCEQAFLSIDPLILSALTITYQIGYTSHEESLSTSYVSSSDTSGLCPGFSVSLWTDDAATNATLQPVLALAGYLSGSQQEYSNFIIFTTDFATEGLYQMYLEAKYDGVYDWQDSYHNGRLDFEINLVNPCKQATLTIDPAIFQGGQTSFQYTVQTPSTEFYEFFEYNPESYVTSSETTVALLCPPIAITVTNEDDSPLNYLAMVYLPSYSYLYVDCDDVTQIGMYNLKIVAYYDDPAYLPRGTISFQLELIDNCMTPTITATEQMTVPDYYYEGNAVFTLTPFIVSPPSCQVTYTCSKTYGTVSNCIDLNLTTWVVNNFVLITNDMIQLPPGAYETQITATGGTNFDIVETITFVINLVDPCPTSTLSLDLLTPWMNLSSYMYTLRDPQYEWAWSHDLAINESTSVDCGPFEVSFYIRSGVDLSLYASYTQGTFTVDYQEDYVGTHLVSYEVAYMNYLESGPTIECLDCFAIIVNDPCDPPTSISLDVPLVDQTYTVDYPALDYYIPSFTTVPDWCTIMSYTWSVGTLALDAYESHSFDTSTAKFTFDEPVSLASTPYDLSTTSTSVVDPYYKDYTLEVEAECNGLVSQSYSFNLRSENPCTKPEYNWINIPAITLDPVIYKINSDQLLIEDIASWFSVENEACGDLLITVDTLAAESSWPGAVIYEENVLKVYTSDLSLSGQTVNILVQLTLLDYPTIAFHAPLETFEQSSLSVILPITLEECVITQIEKPVLDDVIFYYGDDSIEIEYTDFISDEDPECNYFWTYSFDIQSSSYLDDAIMTDLTTKLITIEAETGEDMTATVVLNGQLSNEETTDSVSFIVEFINQVSEESSEEDTTGDIEVELEEETVEDDNTESNADEEAETVRTSEEETIDQQVSDFRFEFLQMEEQRAFSGVEIEEPKPPVPYLAGIEQSGVVVVSFSEDMRIVPDLTMITNGTVSVDGVRRPVFDVEIIPGVDSDPSQLSFGWSVVEMTSRSISIQIYFDTAVYVSSNYEPDIIKLSFVDKTMFVSTDFLTIDLNQASTSRGRQLGIESNYYEQYEYDSDSPQILTLERELPTQLQYGPQAELVGDAVATVGDSSKAFMVASFTMNVLISASLNQLWTLINTQQLIVLMALFKTMIPANAGQFFAQIMEVAAFDIIEIGDTLDEWFELAPIEPDNPNFVTLGLESIYLLNNMGTLAIAYLIWFIAAGIFLIARWGRMEESKQLERVYRRLKRKLFYNSILSIFVESYSLISVCCLINLSYISFETFGLTIHSVICISFFAALFILPIIVFSHLKSGFISLSLSYMKGQFGCMYDGLKLNEGGKVLLVPIFFLVRRLLLAFAVVVANQALIWQIFLMAMQIVTSVIIIGHVKPYDETAKYHKEFFNEVILMLVMYTIICFSPFVPDAVVRFYIGYICIFIVCLHLGVNIYGIARFTFFNIRLKLRLRSAKKAHTKFRKQLQLRLAKNHHNRRDYLKYRRERVKQILTDKQILNQSSSEDDEKDDQISNSGQKQFLPDHDQGINHIDLHTIFEKKSEENDDDDIEFENQQAQLQKLQESQEVHRKDLESIEREIDELNITSNVTTHTPLYDIPLPAQGHSTMSINERQEPNPVCKSTIALSSDQSSSFFDITLQSPKSSKAQRSGEAEEEKYVSTENDPDEIAFMEDPQMAQLYDNYAKISQLADRQLNKHSGPNAERKLGQMLREDPHSLNAIGMFSDEIVMSTQTLNAEHLSTGEFLRQVKMNNVVEKERGSIADMLKSIKKSKIQQEEQQDSFESESEEQPPVQQQIKKKQTRRIQNRAKLRTAIKQQKFILQEIDFCDKQQD